MVTLTNNALQSGGLRIKTTRPPRCFGESDTEPSTIIFMILPGNQTFGISMFLPCPCQGPVYENFPAVLDY